MPTRELYVKKGAAAKKLRRLLDGTEIADGSPVDPETPVGTKRFPGDPGKGKILFGNNHVNGGTIAKVNLKQASGLTAEEFEKAIFTGYTDATRPKLPMVREYSTGFEVGSGTRSDLERWSGQGKVINMSIQSNPDSSTSVENIVIALESLSTNSVKASLNSWCDFMNSLPGPIWHTFNHEPQSHPPDPKVPFASAAAHRQASRLIIEYINQRCNSATAKANGAPGVAHVGPHPVSNDFRVNENWLPYHPEYLNANDGWTTKQYLDMDGWDPYNPSLAAGLKLTTAGVTENPDGTLVWASGARQKKWSDNLYMEYKNRVNQYTNDGYWHKPMCVGELGMYAYQNTQHLWAASAGDNFPGGTTYPVFWNDMIDTCGDTDTVGMNIWNNALAGYTYEAGNPNGRDYYNVKAKALKEAILKTGSKAVLANYGGWAAGE